MSGQQRKQHQGERDRRKEDQGKGKQSSNESSQHQQHKKGANWLERLVSILSVLLLLSAIGYLAWEGTREAAPASFEATVERIWHPADDYYVLLQIENEGGQSVENLGIHAKVVGGGETLAQTRTTLAWLPAHSMRRVTVILGADPREHELEIGFEGYELP